jgi:AraC family transcriptional regulator
MTQANNHQANFTKLVNNESKIDTPIITGIGVKRWSMEKNTVTYQKDDSHTLSLYLKGGESSYRADDSSKKGSAGKICFMPEGQDSQWEINDKVEFIHLYFTNSMLQHHAATHLDIDVRLVELVDLRYQKDEKLKCLIKENFIIGNNPSRFSPLFAEQTINNIMAHLLNHYNAFNVRQETITSGLSSAHMRLVKNVIHQQMDEKLSIEYLAKLITLSPFHFARMFKISFGESPASYITRIRINHAKSLLSSTETLSTISLHTGFSHQSHMTRNFKSQTGITPLAYRQRTYRQVFAQ